MPCYHVFFKINQFLFWCKGCFSRILNSQWSRDALLCSENVCWKYRKKKKRLMSWLSIIFFLDYCNFALALQFSERWSIEILLFKLHHLCYRFIYSERTFKQIGRFISYNQSWFAMALVILHQSNFALSVQLEPHRSMF